MTGHDEPQWQVEVTISAIVTAPHNIAAIKELTNPLRQRLGLEPDADGLDQILTGGIAQLSVRARKLPESPRGVTPEEFMERFGGHAPLDPDRFRADADKAISQQIEDPYDRPAESED